MYLQLYPSNTFIIIVQPRTYVLYMQLVRLPCFLIKKSIEFFFENYIDVDKTIFTILFS